jgi:outer membrane protein, heavy metal efflux system
MQLRFRQLLFLCALGLAPVGSRSAFASADASAGPGTASSPGAVDTLISASTLDLGLLERAVLERNPSLGAMRSAWHAAQAAADQAGALDDPMVDLSSAPRTWRGGDVERAYMIGVSQRFPLFGQRGLKGRAAAASADAVGGDYRTARIDLIREVRRAYYEHYLVARGLEVNAELKDLLGQFHRIALTKYSAGTAGLEDALQAEVELGMLDHQGVALNRERRVLVAQLNALLQRDPGTPLPEPPPELPGASTPERGDSLRAAASRLRPELQGWSAMREARAAELSLARRQRLPDFTFMARYDRFEAEREMRPQVGLSVNLPIQRGRIGAAVREARAGFEEAEYRSKAMQVQVELEVESAFAAAQETEHEVHVLEERVVPATERALQAIRAGYESNRSDFLTLLNAERDLARARLDLYQARVGHLQALADLDRAVGAAPPEPRPEVTR